jgi:hypothetical protein
MILKVCMCTMTNRYKNESEIANTMVREMVSMCKKTKMMVTVNACVLQLTLPKGCVKLNW